MMNITGVEMVSGDEGDFDHIRFEVDNLIYHLTWYGYRNEFVFIKKRQAVGSEPLIKRITRLNIPSSVEDRRNLTLDDFILIHMLGETMFTIRELEIAFLIYGFMFNTDKTEQDFKLELAELLK